MYINKKILINKADSWQMFDQIAGHYDLLNRMLSLGIDRHWRASLANYLSLVKKKNVLDLATGTGDVLITLLKKRPEILQGTGIDLAENMLTIGRTKLGRENLTHKATLKNGDAAAIPWKDNSFENATMAFGIRNVPDPLIVLKEMHRILEDEGRAIILEFSLPANPLLRTLHLFYLRTFIPFIGGVISGHRQAYRYLNKTIEAFPYGEDFCRLMRDAGFREQTAYPLMGGIATIYVGKK